MNQEEVESTFLNELKIFISLSLEKHMNQLLINITTWWDSVKRFKQEFQYPLSDMAFHLLVFEVFEKERLVKDVYQ